MMKKIFFILFTISIGWSQSPGFLGRKFYFLGGGAFDIAFSNPTDYRTTTKSIGSFGINTRWEGSVNYALWKNKSLGLDFRYINTAFALPMGSGYDEQLYWKQGSTSVYFWGVNIKFFFGNNLAPVGPYFKLEAGGAYYDSYLYSPNTQSKVRRIESGTFYVMGSFGRQHIFFKRLMLDYGMQIGFTGTEGLFNKLYNDYTTYDQRVANEFKFRVWQHTLFNFYAGVGLIF